MKKPSVTIQMVTEQFAVARYRNGGGDCLWMDMYFDSKAGNVVAISDVGNYGFCWKANDDVEEFMYDVSARLSNTESLLKHVVDNEELPKEFDRDATEKGIKSLLNGDEDAEEELDNIFYEIDDCANYWQFESEFATIIKERDFDIDEDWFFELVEDYTPQQKTFARICAEYIAPAIESGERTFEGVK